jgi:hypothetical protein
VLLEPLDDEPVDGVEVVVVVVDVEGVVEDEPAAALAIAAPPAPITPAIPSVTSTTRNRFIGHLLRSHRSLVAVNRRLLMRS